jgi:cob(I)alamin adenosyltransferase
MRVSTKKGDSGYTSLLRGERVSKHHLVIEAVGTLDETNSLLGLARASSKESIFSSSGLSFPFPKAEAIRQKRPFLRPT